MQESCEKMPKAKRMRFNPIKKWEVAEENMLVEFLMENRNFEKPTSQSYYKRFAEEKNIGVEWKVVRAKVRNMRTSYNKAKAWEGSTGAGSMDGYSMKNTLLKKFVHYYQFEDIFGSRLDSCAVIEEGLENVSALVMESDYSISFPDETENLVEFVSPVDVEATPTTNRKGIYSRTAVSDIMQTHAELIKLRTQKIEADTASRDREFSLKERELGLKAKELELKEMEILSRERIEKQKVEMQDRLAMEELRLKYKNEMKMNYYSKMKSEFRIFLVFC